MSNSRQPEQAQRPQAIEVRTFAANYLAGSTTGWHVHAWHQLVFARQGVLEVQTLQGCWVVPPSRAVWVAAGLEHSLEATAGVELRTLYLLPEACETAVLPGNVLEVTPLLRELILHVIERGELRAEVSADQHLKAVLLSLLGQMTSPPLELPLPAAGELREIAAFIRAHLADNDVIQLAVRSAGMSRRTLERRFREQVYLSLGKWVQLARLIQASRLLGQGQSVTETAFDVGYESVSAFIAAFKRHFGVTPSKSFGTREEEDAAS